MTLLNHLYWVAGAAIGGIFVMTALFIVIFIEQWMKEKKHYSALTGLGLSVASLILLAETNLLFLLCSPF